MPLWMQEICRESSLRFRLIEHFPLGEELHVHTDMHSRGLESGPPRPAMTAAAMSSAAEASGPPSVTAAAMSSAAHSPYSVFPEFLK